MDKISESSYATGRKEIIIESQGKKIKFFANELGYLASQNIAAQAKLGQKNGLALLVAESITDEEGNRFTYEEIIRLKKEVAEPFFDAVLQIHEKDSEEKKS